MSQEATVNSANIKPLLGNYDGSEKLIATTEGNEIIIKRNTSQSMLGLWAMLVIGVGATLYLALGGTIYDRHMRPLHAENSESAIVMGVLASCILLLFLIMRWRLIHKTPVMRLTNAAVNITQGNKLKASIPFTDIVAADVVEAKRPLGGSAVWTAPSFSLQIKTKKDHLNMFVVPDQKQAQLVKEEIQNRMRN